jgi:hypothetical protein
MRSLPAYRSNELFTTEFQPHYSLPGFFPGAGGFFHGHAHTNRRYFFFGTDFGHLSYQLGLEQTSGEPQSVVTLRNLRSILESARVPLDECFLTNAVLCVRQGESSTDAFPIWSAYADYVRACVHWHRQELAEHKPAGIVCMGVPHLTHFLPLLFPELAEYWRGLTTLKDVYGKQREAPTLADGTRVLLMYHPSYWHLHPKEAKARAISHLAGWHSS